MMIPLHLGAAALLLAGTLCTSNSQAATAQDTPSTDHIPSDSLSLIPTLIVDGPKDYTYDGEDQEYLITSYATRADSADQPERIPMPWTAEFSTDGGETWTDQNPIWLGFPAAGEGATDAQLYSAGVAPQTGTPLGNPHNDALKAAKPVSNYDLSTSGGATPVNTANCYLVNAPGTYSLPLVYGNAIKNGATNRTAYTSKASGVDPLISYGRAAGFPVRPIKEQ